MSVCVCASIFGRTSSDILCLLSSPERLRICGYHSAKLQLTSERILKTMKYASDKINKLIINLLVLQGPDRVLSSSSRNDTVAQQFLLGILVTDRTNSFNPGDNVSD